MKKSKFFLASTAVLLSALGANPVLARDVERSITNTIVSPSVDHHKKDSTEFTEGNQENANASTRANSPSSVTSDKPTPAGPDTIQPSTPNAADKVESPKLQPLPPATPDKVQPKTSDASTKTEPSKTEQLVPEKKYGDVTVEYKSKDGATIAPKIIDTPRSEVGTDYDTTDQRRESIISSEGKKYRLDLKATEGFEQGKVLEGHTNIIYRYDLVPETAESENKVVPPKTDSTTADKEKPSTSDSSNQLTPPAVTPQTPSDPDRSLSPDSSLTDTSPSDGVMDIQNKALDTSGDGVNPSKLTEKKEDVSASPSEGDGKKEEIFNLDDASTVSSKKGDTIDNPIKSIISPADPLLTDKGFEIIGNDQGEVTIKNADGSKTSVPAAQVGARANPDGSVTVKSSNGKFTLLPDTGETTTILATIGLFILALLGFKKVKPFEKDNWLIG